MKQERDFKGVWIPKDLWLSKDLSLQEKVFLVEIDSLDNDNGCFASNKHFAEFFKLTKGRCSQIITSLEEKGYIKTTYKRDGKEITERIIRVVNKLNRYLENDDLGIKYIKGGYLENAKESNTIISNTIYNTNALFEDFWKAYPKKVKKKNARDKFLKLKVDEELFNVIINKLEAFKKTEQWKKDNGKFIPYPDTWLNQERWEDEIEVKKEGVKLDYL